LGSAVKEEAKMIGSKKLEERLRGRNYNQSLLRKFRKEKKINKETEKLISYLTLEDLIALKLELAAESVRGKFYGFPIFKATTQIVKESVIKFALSVTSSHKKAAMVLGLSLSELKRYVKKYDINKQLD